MLSGKGIFIWEIAQCDGGEPARLVALARAAGIGHVIFKLSDGTFNYPIPARDPGGALELKTDAAIRAFKNAGIPVWGLAHVYGSDPVMEAHRAASRVLRWRLDGLVVNPQIQFTGQQAKAREFMSTLRRDLGPDVPLAFSLFRLPDSVDSPAAPQDDRFPVDAFAAPADILMPQVFWIARDGGDPAGTLRESYRQYRERYPNKPYIPTGAAFGERYGTLEWSATPAQIELFLGQARALGFEAANFWSWQHARNDRNNPRYAGTQLWDALAAYPWPVDSSGPGPEDPPPPEEDPFADGVEIVPPGDGRYMDGVYGRTPSLQFSVIPSQHGPVKYTPTNATHSLCWAQWVPGITTDGRYEVAVWVPGTHATTHRARYHIRGVKGQDSTLIVELDQNRYYDRFVPLGIFELEGSRPDAGAVNLTNLTGESGREIAFSPLRWKLLESSGPVLVADGYDAPVGTTDERKKDALWPGHWVDAVGFGTRYRDSSNTTAYHTGADLNLNAPRWDSDRGAGVFAVASGTIVFVGGLAVWGQVIVIRHDPVEPQGNAVWARYAHVAEARVRAGDRVQRGQQIAVIGKPAPSGAPYHLHFDICTSDILEERPDHWPRLSYTELITHYVDPREFLRANRPPQHMR
ncbi:MAG: peptidoglycan DD-metalloendopeptidase family protein [Anaerolineae bacterium]|nr:peptidoglycan DD-metalloendopeptidase family protein [Anaerolineae bacterium]